MGHAFDLFDHTDIRDLIAQYPLAWITSADGEASVLPLLGEYDDAGQLVSLLGHVARRNPLHAALVRDSSARILINGPSGYVSPSHAERRNWAPTWNFAHLVLQAEISFLPDETHTALSALVTAMEGDGWSSAELGPRYDGMAQQVIAFRARVTGVTGRFKLGQDEDDQVFSAILRNHPDTALTGWMRRFATDRQAGAVPPDGTGPLPRP